jgi:hypothetical protein
MRLDLYATRRQLRKPDAQLTTTRVSEKLDLVDALSQLVEDREAAPEQGPTIDRWLDALRRAVEQTDTEDVFEVNKRLRTTYDRTSPASGTSI